MLHLDIIHIYIYILRMMLQIQKHHSLLKPYLSHLRKGCHDGYAAGRMIQLSPSMNTSSVVRTFLTSVGASTCQLRNNNHFHHPFASEVSIQRSHQNHNNIKSATSRHLSSSPIPEPNIPPPKKYVLPSNLVFDPKSHFVHMFDNESSRNRVTDKPSRSTAPGAAASVETEVAQREQEEDDDKDESWYDDEEDDDDDGFDEELFDDEDGLIYPYQEGVVYSKPLPERLNVEIHTLFRTPSLVGSIHLNESVFGLDPIRVDLLKRSVDYFRAKKRGRRNAVTKTISEVSGSGRKIRKQKGGGTSRAGHSRPPHFRGGAKAHGPKNITDYGNIKLNKKVRQLATRHVFSQKLKEGNLILLNHMHELPTHKTNDLARLLSTWKIGGLNGRSAIILDHYYNKAEEDSTILNSITTDSKPSSHAGVPTNLHVAARNIPGLKVTNSHGASVYDILKHEKLFITLSALEQIETRLKL